MLSWVSAARIKNSQNNVKKAKTLTHWRTKIERKTTDTQFHVCFACSLYRTRAGCAYRSAGFTERSNGDTLNPTEYLLSNRRITTFPWTSLSMFLVMPENSLSVHDVKTESQATMFHAIVLDDPRNLEITEKHSWILSDFRPQGPCTRARRRTCAIKPSEYYSLNRPALFQSV